MAGPTLTAAGLTIQTIDEIVAETLAALRVNASEPGLLAEPGSALGSILLTNAERERLLQELAQAVYSAFSIDASGTSLDRVGIAFGISRKAATQSTVTVPVTNGGGGPVTISAGSQLENSDTGDQFSVLAAVTIGAGLSDNISCRAIVAGSVPVPATITWAWITAGYGAVTFGNNAAGVQGSDAETNAEMRTRWLISLANPGAGTLDSIVAALAGVDGMDSVRAFENTSSATGITSPETVSALPGHSFVALTRGSATSANIAAAIWQTKPAGIASYGSTSAAVVDDYGVSHTVYWEAATANATTVTVTVTGSSSSYDAAITDAIEAYFEALDISDDVIAQRVACAVLDAAGDDATLVSVVLDALGANADKTIAWNKYATLSGAPTINHI